MKATNKIQKLYEYFEGEIVFEYLQSETITLKFVLHIKHYAR